MDASTPPLPRQPRGRDRDRDRPQLSSRRLKPPHPISTADANREFHRDIPHDRADRDRDTYPDRDGPASPEIISSLITSLAVISKPASNHFDSPSYLDPGADTRNSRSRSPSSRAVPESPTTGRPDASASASASGAGSFGVDYGAFSQPPLDDLQEEDIPLDELAASPPVIRTAKPPSGFSALTAPKSPKSPRDGPGLKSLLSGRGSSSAVNVSRPSSRGSLASAAESIGNLSIERGTTSPIADPIGLRRQRSHDSWGKKTARNNRGLMYMSSKERLREKEFERKRASGGAVGGGANKHGSPDSQRPDPFLAESVINEESPIDSQHPDRRSAGPDGAGNGPSPRPIPTRDSSLRKSGSNSRRASARASRSSKRDSDAGPSNTIHETDERTHDSGPHRWESTRRKNQDTTQAEDTERKKQSLDIPQRSKANPSSGNLKPDAFNPSPSPSGASSPMPSAVEFDPEEGAPFPAVAQGRRRDRDASADARYRRRSGRQTPDIFSGYGSEGGGGVSLKLKRSSSRLKRLSGAASATPDRVSLDHGAAAGGNTHSDQLQIAYERPPSADSIDDSVESYLCSPRLSQKIKHPQTGRVISFSEVGDPNGSAVFCCVGMGLTRYITAFYDELALTLKLRLITPDRPGVGDSEPYAEGTATPLGWPDDVYAICQSLKITKFSILAHSAGAIYALATALRMPQHIRGRIHLLAPWIPPSQMSVFGASAQTPLPPTNAIPTSQRILRALPTPILKAANSSFMTATSSSITSSLPKQKRAKRERRTAAAVAAKEANGKAASPTETDNKENHNVGHGRDKGLPPAPGNDFGMSVSESMDRIMAAGTGPAPEPPTLSQPSANGHQHHRSNSSAQRNTAASRRPHEKDDRILSAAANLANSQLADRERQQIYDSRLTHAIWQLATTGANPAVDLLVCLERRHTIGFRYVDITRPVVIHHGSRDTRVPVENVKWLGKTMRRCEVRVLEGEGHGLMASAQVMGGVLMEISREWEEWGRVTGSTKRENERARRGTIGQAR